jgi:integrase
MAAGAAWVDTGHVFATMSGRPHHAATISRAFDKALTRAELPDVRFHDLRHSAATFLLAQGMTLEDAKQLLVHSSITLTSNTYGHVLKAAPAAGGTSDARGAKRLNPNGFGSIGRLTLKG